MKQYFLYFSFEREMLFIIGPHSPSKVSSIAVIVITIRIHLVNTLINIYLSFRFLFELCYIYSICDTCQLLLAADHSVV